MKTAIRRPLLMGFLGVLALLLLFVLLRVARPPAGLSIVVVEGDRSRRVTLADLKRLPEVVRDGAYQNQYGNWGGEGRYRGVLLVDVLGSGAIYDELTIRAADGYEARLSRRRVEDSAYPVVLAYAKDDVSVPGWEDGFQLVILPLDGGVSNAEYEAPSAGSFWVSRVVEIALVGPE